ncbi:MAG: helix-turn-helix domain-containing protein [Roseovarius sp.]
MEDFRSGTRTSQTWRKSRSTEVAEAFDANYLNYQYRFVEFFIDHLSDTSRAFKGDLQCMLVLAMIGQKWLSAVRDAVAEGIDPGSLPTASNSTSASRIADVTGIPRQTVRRKLASLDERGWIQRNEDSTYRLVVAEGEAAARRDLSDIDQRALQRVARLFTDLEKLVAAHDPDVIGREAQQEANEACEEPAQNEHALRSKD